MDGVDGWHWGLAPGREHFHSLQRYGILTRIPCQTAFSNFIDLIRGKEESRGGVFQELGKELHGGAFSAVLPGFPRPAAQCPQTAAASRRSVPSARGHWRVPGSGRREGVAAFLVLWKCATFASSPPGVAAGSLYPGHLEKWPV